MQSQERCLDKLQLHVRDLRTLMQKQKRRVSLPEMNITLPEKWHADPDSGMQGLIEDLPEAKEARKAPPALMKQVDLGTGATSLAARSEVLAAKAAASMSISPPAASTSPNLWKPVVRL